MKLQFAKKNNGNINIENAVIRSIKKNHGVKPQGRRYNDFELSIGIGALNVNKKCHNFIDKNIMALPNVATIKKATSMLMQKVK